MPAIRILPVLIFSLLAVSCAAQESLTLSGSLESRVNYYMRDSAIGAANNPQFEHQLVGLETWLSLQARVSGFDLGIRYDIFANSALLNPKDSYSDQGIGRWYVGKKIGKLGILVGHIYDQIGSGVIFKAYEERSLLIDNALVGLKLTYELSPNWAIKGIAGRQKNLFDLYPSLLKGLSIDGFKSFGEEGKVSIAPGAGIMHKTLSDQQMDALAGAISQYTPGDFIDEAPFNTLAGTVYNTLTAGRFTWYAEASYKTEEVIFDPFANRTLWTGVQTAGKFVLKPGYLTYTSLTYAGGGLGITGQYKRTRNFNYRTDPFVSLNRGMINFLPPMSRINSYRLTSRYAPATQDLDEAAVQLDATYAINKNLSVLINVSNINRPKAEENHDIYSEIYSQITYKIPRKWILTTGVQYQKYNQELYEGKPGVPNVKAITPYLDYLVHLDQKKSLRTEIQYMSTDEDFGSWIYGLEEFSISPHWVFELSDMWNIKPYINEDGTKKTDDLHYPTVGIVFNAERTRYSLRYVKQVEGIICSGGICRLEPAFSGFKFNLTSSF